FSFRLPRSILLYPARALLGDGADAFAIGSENIASLRDRGRVIDMDDGAPGSTQCLEGARNDVLACLGQHLDGDIVRDPILFDKVADEIEIGLRCRGKPDLDLLKADGDELVEQTLFLCGVHRPWQGLVAVAQVDAAPLRRGS